MSGMHKQNGKYKARIAVNNQTVHLGTFGTEEEAALVYDAACLALGRPVSAFNEPNVFVTAAVFQKVVGVLVAKEVFGEAEVDNILARQAAINNVAIVLDAEVYEDDLTAALHYDNPSRKGS